MSGYRLRPLVLDRDEEDLWVAALPSGPISQVSGAGELIIGVLEESGASGRTAAEITQELEEMLGDVPEDAEESIVTFLAEMEKIGVVQCADADSGEASGGAVS